MDQINLTPEALETRLSLREVEDLARLLGKAANRGLNEVESQEADHYFEVFNQSAQMMRNMASLEEKVAEQRFARQQADSLALQEQGAKPANGKVLATGDEAHSMVSSLYGSRPSPKIDQ